MKTIRQRQNAIFEFIRDYILKKGYPPTVREICKALNISSTSTVYNDINALVEGGLLTKNPSKPRAIMLSPELRKDLIISSDNEITYESDSPDTVNIPIIGDVSAGTGILAEENIEEYLPLPEQYFSSKDHFILKVRGDSMINAGIFGGDYIIVEKCDRAENGDTVVAMLDGFETEATVKTFYDEGDKVRLQPENDEYSPIYADRVRILGKVKGVFRYYS